MSLTLIKNSVHSENSDSDNCILFRIEGAANWYAVQVSDTTMFNSSTTVCYKNNSPCTVLTGKF